MAGRRRRPLPPTGRAKREAFQVKDFYGGGGQALPVYHQNARSFRHAEVASEDEQRGEECRAAMGHVLQPYALAAPSVRPIAARELR